MVDLSKEMPIIGQQCICPDGLGRVVDWGHNLNSAFVQVDTYIKNKSFKWNPANVDLIPIISSSVERSIPVPIATVPTVDPLKNLFDGAPVMISDCGTSWTKRFYKRDSRCYVNRLSKWVADREGSTKWGHIRLPTIAESPRNTFLAAPADGKCPEGAEELSIMVWQEGGDFPLNGKLFGKNWEWNCIEKFMILDKKDF